MKNHLFLLLLTISFLFSDAQTLTGKVFDSETNEPIAGVHVYTKNQEEVTLTNRNGKFRLKIGKHKSKRDTLYFSHVEYKIVHILISEIDKNFELSLQKQVNSLNEVSVLSNKKLKPYINFEELASIDKGVYSFGSTIIDDKIYVFGGEQTFNVDEVTQAFKGFTPVDIHDEVDLELIFRKSIEFSEKRTFNSKIKVYDINNDLWKIEEEPKTIERSNHNVIYNKDKIYIIGGKRLSPNKRMEYLEPFIEVYDIKNKTVEVDKTNPHQAVNLQSFIYQDNIIVLGGSLKKFLNGTVRYSNKIHMYNTKTGYWYELGKMKTGKECRGTLVGDKIYIFGGFKDRERSEVEIFDLNTGKWKKVGKLFTKLRKPAIAINNQIIYLFEEGNLYTYDIATKELNQFTIGLPLKDAEMHFYNNKLYIIGGYKQLVASQESSSGLYSVEIEEFDKTKPKLYQKF